MAPEMLLMSKVVCDKLPKADQDMIRAAAKESVAFQRKKWDEQEAKSLARGQGRRRQIVDVDKASFQAAMEPVYDKFITDARPASAWSRRSRTPSKPGLPLARGLSPDIPASSPAAPCAGALASGTTPHLVAPCIRAVRVLSKACLMLAVVG